MRILIVGGGGREHALAWKMACSDQVSKVFVAPGNAGTRAEKKVSNIDISTTDIERLVEFAGSESVDLTVIGPEAPLVAGIVDRFQETGLKCFGPSSDAAMLEGSKSFAKEFMQQYEIPTAEYQSFSDANAALEYLGERNFPIVIKADGLAAGKGVIIVDDLKSAESTVHEMLSGNSFGEAGSNVVIEEFLQGEEVSYICLVDGVSILPMASSQDHKSAFDGDLGPNTGGMGAYSPAPIVNDQLERRILEQVINPVVRGMNQRGTPYVGFLYAGLMVDSEGNPRVIEFNCRFGDPEAQPILARLTSDLAMHCYAAVNGRLDLETAEWDSRCCLGVVMAADGYPEQYSSGNRISGLDNSLEHTRVFHAGTNQQNQDVVTAGGRVLCVTGFGKTVSEAKALAYQRAAQISWQGSWYRNDIGHRAIAREQS